MPKIFSRLFCIALLYFGLSGCAAVIVGGVVAVAGVAGTTVAVASDPRTTGGLIDDNNIETKLKSKFLEYKDSNIYVHSYNGNLLLTGQVVNANVRESAEFEAKATPGVKQIYDYLDLRLPQSFASITRDTYTTTQLRTKILNLNNVSINNIKVITTNDVVYLMGVVTPEQGKQVAMAASKVGGVTKVITLFQYITSK